LLSGSGLG